jgi:NodT family efflux transporter outer membrane factor (OMF) lipoprotein
MYRLKSTPAHWRLAPLALSLALGACAVGPHYQTPAALPTESDAKYTEGALATQTAAAPGKGGEAQQFGVGQDIPAQWWTLFQSAPLDQLVRQALANSPTLGAAQAALRQAEENYSSVSGSLNAPAVSANLTGGRERSAALNSGVPGGVEYNLYNASVNVSYSIDVFGANHNALEGQQALIDYQRFQVEAAYLTLTSNVVTAAIREASQRAQLKASQEMLQDQAHQLALVEQQYAAGAIALPAVLAQRSALANFRAGIPALEKSLALTRHQLAVLAGQAPGHSELAQFDLDSLTLPRDLPVSLGSELVRQRPDIRASEALLHQASAQIGVATANLYPQFNLTAGISSTATYPSQMFNAAAAGWSLLGGITQPLFNGGALDAKRRAAQAAYESAQSQYRGVVLQAFQNVADSLRALEFDASTLQQQAEAEDIAKQSLDISQRQYEVGAVNYLALLDARRNYQQAYINRVSARAARYADTAALFQALGGGWWNRTSLPQASLPTPIADH